MAVIITENTKLIEQNYMKLTDNTYRDKVISIAQHT